MEEEIKPTEAIMSPETSVQLKKKSNLPRIVILLVAILLIGGGLMFGIQIGKKQSAGGSSKKATPTLIPQPIGIPTSIPVPNGSISTPGETERWKIYKSNIYGIELKYPPNYEISENSVSLDILAPLSKCNPKLIFNIEEYEYIREVEIHLKRRYGDIEKILKEEGGIEWGWQKTSIKAKEAYKFIESAEMITPRYRYLVAISPTETIELEIYVFGSGGGEKCTPTVSVGNANKIKDQILSTFKFTQ